MPLFRRPRLSAPLTLLSELNSSSVESSRTPKRTRRTASDSDGSQECMSKARSWEQNGAGKDGFVQPKRPKRPKAARFHPPSGFMPAVSGLLRPKSTLERKVARKRDRHSARGMKRRPMRPCSPNARQNGGARLCIHTPCSMEARLVQWRLHIWHRTRGAIHIRLPREDPTCAQIQSSPTLGRQAVSALCFLYNVRMGRSMIVFSISVVLLWWLLCSIARLKHKPPVQAVPSPLSNAERMSSQFEIPVSSGIDLHRCSQEPQMRIVLDRTR